MTSQFKARRGLAAIAVAALVAPAAAVVSAPAAHAEPVGSAVSGVEFRWAISPASISSSHAGANFFSAGLIGNPEASSTLNAADSGATWANGKAAGWNAKSGNVTIEKKAADGTYAQTDWAGARTATVGGTSETQVALAAGTGTADAASDTASIEWDGDFTSLHYNGLAYYTVSDPTLQVVDGVGTLTASLSGASAGREGGSWNVTAPAEVTLATFDDVDVTPWGIEIAPDYLGVNNGTATQAAQTPENAAWWGSFPTSFVNFQAATGLAAFFQTSSPSADQSNRIASPIKVSGLAAAPKVKVSSSVASPDGTTKLTVEGTGFAPEAALGTRPPLAGKPVGAYVTLGKFAADWRPSADAAISTRVGLKAAQKWAVLEESIATIGGATAGAIELKADGSFTTELTIDKAALDAEVATKANAADLVNYGIYTYAGSGAKVAEYETYTPISFPSVKVSETTVMDDGTSKITVSGTGFSPDAALGTRPPLAGKPVGAYVTLGKFAADWRPSADAAISTRVGLKAAQKWAVLAESIPTIGGDAAGAIELKADGSFTTELTIDKAALDAEVATKANAADLVNYGIYTYAGSGAKVSGYETYTPLTFTSISDGTIRFAKPVVGKAVNATVSGLTAPGAKHSYQWLANGKAIKGATKISYTPTAAQAGQKLALTVTSTVNSVVTKSKTSTAVTVAKGTQAIGVKVTGKTKVGKKLTASVTGATGAKVTYKWFYGKKTIKGAKSKTVKLKKAHAGKKIKVQVTVTKAGYTTVVKTSSVTKKIKR